MSDMIKELLELTRIDRQLVKCRQRSLAGPQEIALQEQKIAKLAEGFEKSREEVRAQTLDSDRHALDAHTAAAEVAQIQQRLQNVKNNAEYTHLNDRLRDLRAVIDEKESTILKGMETIDRLRATENDRRGLLDDGRAALEKLKADVAAEAARIQERQRELKAKRQIQLRRAADVSPVALEVYNTALQRTRGDAMAVLADNVCQACYRTQNPNVLDAILLGRDPHAMVCPGCGRILYRPSDAKPDNPVDD